MKKRMRFKATHWRALDHERGLLLEVEELPSGAAAWEVTCSRNYQRRSGGARSPKLARARAREVAAEIVLLPRLRMELPY